MKSDELIVSSPYKVEVPNVDVSTFLRSFRHDPFKIATIDLETGERYTYKEVEEKSDNFIAAMTMLGLTKGSRIVIFMPNCIEFEVVLLAALSIGVIVAPINHLTSADELSHYLDVVNCDLVVTSECCAQKLTSVLLRRGQHNTKVIVRNQYKGCISLKDCLTDPARALNRSIPENIKNNVTIDPSADIAIILFSSGTTGLPKGVTLSNLNIVSALCQFRHSVYDGSEDSRYSLVYMPFSHGYGMFRIFNCFASSTTILVLSKFDIRAFFKAIEDYKLTSVHVVPSVTVMICNSEVIKEYDVTSIKAIFTSAAPMGPELDKKLKSVMGGDITIIQEYGLTECVGIISQIPLNDPNISNIPRGTVGLLYPNTVAKVVHPETQNVLGPGEEGEILLKGQQIMLGYLDNPQATSDTITYDGFLRSGDIGYYDENGFFFIKDRLKELIKCKGLQVAPAELECILLGHPCVNDAAVVGIPDELFGEKPHAWIVKKPQSACTENDIIRWTAERVSPHKRLTGGVKFVDSIPKLESGKILRRVIRKQINKSKL